MVSATRVDTERWRATAGQQARALLLAIVFTAALFLALPYVELISMATGRRVLVTELDTVPVVPSPPAQRAPQRRVQERQQAAKQLPKPRLARTQQPRIPITASLNLGMALGDVRGDFDVGFSFEPGALAARIDKAVFSIDDVDRAPQAGVRLRPTYPLQARMRGQEGSVMLEFVVDSNGWTRDITAVSAEPGNVFVRAAVRAVERWRFKPGMRGGRAVSVRVWQRISFRLEGQ